MKLEELEEQGWTMNVEIECPGCNRTAELWVSPNGTGQAENCANCGFEVKAYQTPDTKK